MFGSNSKTTAKPSTNSGGFLSRLRSSNKPAGTKGPVYNTSSRNSRATGNTSSVIGGKKASRRKKTVATGPAPMSHHRTKPTISQKIHGAAKVMSGEMHNDHREVRQGEKEMHGQSSSGPFSSSGLNSKRV